MKKSCARNSASDSPLPCPAAGSSNIPNHSKTVSTLLVKVHSSSLNGMSAMSVVLEVNSSKKNTQDGALYFMVGLPDNAVKESRMRVLSALSNTKHALPPNQMYTINFAPADVRKEGSGYDLPLAIGLLAVNKMVKTDLLDKFVFVGELGLDGSIRPIRGGLSIAIKARAEGFEGLIVPKANEREAAVVNRLKVYGAERLTDVIAFLNGNTDSLQQTIVNTREEFYAAQINTPLDFADVKGQENVKRAFEVAAAGGHNILIVGSPGCGKSMMAKRIPSILPQLTLAESLETTQIHSVAGKLGSETSLVSQRPFRSPHHTISDVALIGGGVQCKPGEISLAHNGILFLDELPEFSRTALETLRQPLEDREITISRAKYTITLPCSFMLVASMNPCPCGYYKDPSHHCSCSPAQRINYKNKISGPLLDRIDIQIEVTPVPVDELASAPTGEHSAAIRERVVKARAIQTERFNDTPGVHCNAQMTRAQIEKYAVLNEEGTNLLKRAMKRLNLSARAYDRILRVARTIADLEGSPDILPDHVAEAVSYRNLDRGGWGE